MVQEAPFDLGAETTVFAQGRKDMGAVVTFTGIVRDTGDARLEAMEIEHYPGMTEDALCTLAEAAMDRWSLFGVTILHRVGRMEVGERIVFIGTAAAHRREALDACAYLIDRLKTDAPFWKRARP